jgi:hypothetical protein
VRPAARGATNDSPSSARARAVTALLRERRRAPLRSAGAKRETHLTTDAISVNEGAFAKRDERLSSQRPLRERNPIRMGEAPVKYELAGAS